MDFLSSLNSALEVDRHIISSFNKQTGEIKDKWNREYADSVERMTSSLAENRAETPRTEVRRPRPSPYWIPSKPRRK